MRGDGSNLAARHLNREIDLPLVADLDDDWIGPSAAREKMRDQLNRFLRSRQADANRAPRRQGLQPFEGQGEVRSPFVIRDRMNFIHDDGFNRLENFAAALGGEENVEGFGRCHQDVRRAREHRPPVFHQRVARSNGGSNFGHEHAACARQLKNFPERLLQIFLNVVPERLQRRHV
jgi:hypothetical protein